MPRTGAQPDLGGHPQSGRGAEPPSIRETLDAVTARLKEYALVVAPDGVSSRDDGQAMRLLKPIVEASEPTRKAPEPEPRPV